MDIRFDGKVIVVIGGSTGIGKATVQQFVQSGGYVVFTGIEEESAITIGEYTTEVCPTPEYYRLDVRQEKAVKKFAEHVEKKYNGADILFNNAGILTSKMLHEITTKEWQKVLDINVTGMFFTSKYFIPQMIARNGGAIINTCSISGLFADNTLCAYNTAKGAIANLTRNMAIDYIKYNIRVNAVAPGSIRTPMYYGFIEVAGSLEALEAGHNRVYPTGRIGLPDEVASAVLFLASDKASFINGIILTIDGGLTAHSGSPKNFNIEEA